MTVLWGLSFEIDRVVQTLEAADAAQVAAWPDMQLIFLWSTLLWAAGGLATLIHGRRQSVAPMAVTGAMFLFGGAVAWLSVGTLVYRFMDGVVQTTIVLNPQFAVGALLIVLLGAAAFLVRSVGQDDRIGEFRIADFIAGTLGLIATIGLWLGTLEIDRWFGGGALGTASMAKQTGFSIWWGVYGIGLVAAGFRWRSAAARYAGLGLLGVTLLKVALVDTSQLEGVYRPLSYIAIGLIFVLTSIAYAKLSPRILRHAPATEEA